MKIFIIDDEEVSIFLTRRMLLLKGFTKGVEAFLSAAEALATLQARREEDMPDAILLDLNMPLMDGWQFLDAVAGLGPAFGEKCRIYILTSSLDHSDVVRVQNYPIVSGYLHKPISFEDIKKISAQGDPPVGAE